MQSLFNPTTAAQFIARAQQLNPQTQGLWGKMDVAQMLTHCNIALRMALTNKKIKNTILGSTLGWLIAKIMLRNKPWQRNLPTAKQMVISSPQNFAQQQQKFIAQITDLHQRPPQNVAQNPHPIFGKLSHAQWGNLLYIHLNHHLQQFGV
jgi:adenylosuccinate synthase